MATTARKSGKSKPKYTPEEVAAYRAEQREKGAELMKAAVSELLTSDGWQKWAAMRARLHGYSLNNTLLILIQCPEATMVASGKFWKEQNRYITSGTGSALRIFAPLFRRPTSDEIAAGRDPESKVLYSFKLVPVFDVSQTDGEPLPSKPSQPVTGDSHASFLRPLEVLAQKLGYSVSFESLSPGLGGYCDKNRNHIAIRNDVAPNAQVRTLIHEIAHALGIGYEGYGREQAEVLVETATFIVSTSIGLDTTGASVPYVASWGEANAVAAIEAFAGVVDKVARQIESAVKDAEVVA
jgi:hypothetical protein